MNNIQYAIHREDGLVISRVGNEVAWPVMDFEGIGKGGDYRKPIDYNLEKMNVHSIGREWQMLVWTKYVPTELKNKHRAFWGMKPLPVEDPPRTVKELCQRHKTRFYYVKDDEIGICHGTWGSNVKLYHWFQKTRRGYILSDVTDNCDDKHKDAVRREIRRNGHNLLRV